MRCAAVLLAGVALMLPGAGFPDGAADPSAKWFRVVVMPGKARPRELRAVADEVADLVVNHMHALKRFEVIERSHLARILEEHKLKLSGLAEDTEPFEIGKILVAQIGLVVQLSAFDQSPIEHQVEVEEEEEVDEEVEQVNRRGDTVKVKTGKKITVKRTRTVTRRSVRTEITVTLKRLDIERGTTEGSVSARGSAVADDEAASKAEALSQLSDALRLDLRRLFTLEMRVAALVDGAVQARAGEGVGIEPGMLFKVVRKEAVKRGIHEGTVAREIGLVEVREVTAATFEAVAVRRYGDFREGDQLVEVVGGDAAFGLGLLVHERLTTAYLEFEGRRYQGVSAGLYLEGGVLRDSTSASVVTAGLGLLIRGKLLRWDWLQFGLEARLGARGGLRTDDNGQAVTALGFGASAGPGLELYLGKDLSFFAVGQVHLGTSLARWEFFQDKQWNAGTFTGGAPKADPGGPQLLAGLKWSLF